MLVGGQVELNRFFILFLIAKKLLLEFGNIRSKDYFAWFHQVVDADGRFVFALKFGQPFGLFLLFTLFGSDGTGTEAFACHFNCRIVHTIGVIEFAR